MRTIEAFGRERPFSAVFLMAAFFLGIILFFFRIYFLSNDDTFKIFSLKGIGNVLTPTEYLVYSNVVIGQWLKSLYGLSPNISWYGLYLVLNLFLFLACLFGAFLAKSSSKFQWFLLAVTLAAFQVFYVIDMQFTSIAIFETFGALLLIASLPRLSNPLQVKAGLVLSGLSLWLAMLTRWDSFALALLCFLPVLALGVHENWRWARKNKRTLGVFLLALCFFILGSRGLDRFHYAHNGAWSNFMVFNKVRTSLLDYKNLKYDSQTIPSLNSVGWSSNDLAAFNSWFFLDDQKYSVQNLEKLEKAYSGQSAYDFFLAFFRITTYQTVRIAVLFFAVFLLFLPRGRLGLVGVYTLSISTAVFYLICYMKAPQHVIFPLLISLLYWVLYQLEVPRSESKTHPLKKILRVLAVLVLLFQAFSLLKIYVSTDRDWVRQEKELKSSLSCLNPTDQQLFVVWGSAFPYELIGALDDFEIFRHFNILSLAVFQRSPVAREMLDHFKIKDLFLDLVDHPNVFLICDRNEGVIYGNYMRENHHLEVRAEKVFAGYSFNVFKVRSVGRDRR